MASSFRLDPLVLLSYGLCGFVALLPWSQADVSLRYPGFGKRLLQELFHTTVSIHWVPSHKLEHARTIRNGDL